MPQCKWAHRYEIGKRPFGTQFDLKTNIIWIDFDCVMLKHITRSELFPGTRLLRLWSRTRPNLFPRYKPVPSSNLSSFKCLRNFLHVHLPLFFYLQNLMNPLWGNNCGKQLSLVRSQYTHFMWGKLITWCMVLPMKPAWVIPNGNSSDGHVVGSLLNLCLKSTI